MVVKSPEKVQCPEFNQGADKKRQLKAGKSPEKMQKF